MALNLSTTGIVDGQVITAAQITQSIDALTAAAAYNITISGSFSMGLNTTGSGTYNRSLRTQTVELLSLGVNNDYTIPYLASTGSSTTNICYSGTSPSYNPVTETLGAYVPLHPTRLDGNTLVFEDEFDNPINLQRTRASVNTGLQAWPGQITHAN